MIPRQVKTYSFFELLKSKDVKIYYNRLINNKRVCIPYSKSNLLSKYDKDLIVLQTMPRRFNVIDADNVNEYYFVHFNV